jgi:hypothetical protein
MYRKVIWSPVEDDYLKKNKALPVNQLTIALAKSRNAIKNRLLELDGRVPKPSKRKNPSKIGKRKDLNGFYRSGWEANLARYLKHLDIPGAIVEFEPTTFTFTNFGIYKGTVSYTPDFKVTYKDGSYQWIEVKGYLKPKDKTALRRFKKFYPHDFEKLLCVPGSASTKAAKFFAEDIGVPVFKYYNDLNKKYRSAIPHWE